MSLTYQEVAKEAMKLSPEAWDVENERRVAQLDAGELETYAVEDVVAELRAKLQ